MYSKNVTMKTLFTAIILSACSIMVQAQCENAYFPMKDGVTFEQTSYNAKDKKEGKVISTISATTNTQLVVQNKIYDKKDELITEGDYEVFCEDGKVKMDFEQFIPDELLSSYQNMEVNIEGDFLEFPNNLSVGQNLPDANGTITIVMAEGAMNMKTTITLTFTNRKVELQESITTPAGTFETFKVSQTTISAMEIMGMSRETTFSSASWIAEGVGAVRSENYDKKGKLAGYQVLTSFE